MRVFASKIEILVGIIMFAEPVLSLLLTLGRSANLSEPWAPRKELSRRYATLIIKKTAKHLAI